MVEAEIGTLVTVLQAIDNDTRSSDNVTYEFGEYLEFCALNTVQ